MKAHSVSHKTFADETSLLIALASFFLQFQMMFPGNYVSQEFSLLFRIPLFFNWLFLRFHSKFQLNFQLIWHCYFRLHFIFLISQIIHLKLISKTLLLKFVCLLYFHPISTIHKLAPLLRRCLIISTELSCHNDQILSNLATLNLLNVSSFNRIISSSLIFILIILFYDFKILFLFLFKIWQNNIFW